MPRLLISIVDKTPQPYRFDIDRPVVTLGRGSDNDIVIDCSSVSGRHVEMRRTLGGYELVDVGSTNGCFHRGEPVRHVTLYHGAEVLLGEVGFRIDLSDEELAALPGMRPEPVQPQLPVARLTKTEQLAALDEEDVPYASSGGGGFGSLVTFILLVAIAFGVGLSWRYKQDTGGLLPSAVLEHFTALKPAPAPASSPGEAAPPADEEARADGGK